MQFGVTLVNAMLDQIETTIGTAPILRIYTGAAPANCAAASTGTLLVEMTLPSDWMNAASATSKTKNGTWQDASANGTGTAGYFRIFNSGDTVCHIQGTVGLSGSGEDMIIDNTSIASGQQVTVASFTLNGGNA